MNALPGSPYSTPWRNLSRALPQPQAILVISAHWLTTGTLVHASPHPKTLYDFYGFPPELYALTYPAPGSPTLAHEMSERTVFTKEDTSWGLDHGAWSVLNHLYPEARIPVFQMSIDITASSQRMKQIGREIAYLRTKGVLIIGSGNLVHNLGRMTWEESEAYDWALDADAQIASMINLHQDDELLRTDHNEAIRLAIPTTEHYVPLLYLLGAESKSDTRSFPITGIAHGSISMRSVLFS